MNKVKIIILCTFIGIVLIVGIGLGMFYNFKLKNIVSVLTIDINPSISISLNYKNEIVKTTWLNDDGKELLKKKDLKGLSLEKAIEIVTKYVVENDYVNKDNNYVLFNIEGKNINGEVVKLFENEFKKQNVECNIIVQKIDEKDKQNAKKYEISENKASYINSIIKDNEDIDFEELIDKSIVQINKIIEEKEVELKKEDEQNKPDLSDEVSNNTNKPSNPSSPSGVLPKPANDDRSGAWCDFIASIPPWGGVDYDTPGKINDLNVFYEKAKTFLPSDIDTSGFGGSSGGWYKTASYCSAATINVNNISKTKKYTVYIDSVTLELLDLKIIDVPIPTVDQAAAKVLATNWLLNTYNVDINACGAESFYYSIDSKPEWQFSIKCENPTVRYYALHISALTGELYSGRTWGPGGV